MPRSSSTWWKRPEIILAAVPAAIGYATSAACRMPPSDDIPFRPPGWVFAVVWPILYALLGGAWFRSAIREGATSWRSGIYALASVLLGLWLVVYSCLRRSREAVFVLLAAAAAAMSCVTASDDAVERLMVTPLVVWLAFATLMNAWQVGTTAASASASASAPTTNPAPTLPMAPDIAHELTRGRDEQRSTEPPLVGPMHSMDTMATY